MIKRIAAWGIVLVLLFTLTACEDPLTTKTDTQTASVTESVVAVPSAVQPTQEDLSSTAPTTSVTPSLSKITKQQAKEIALRHAGIPLDAVLDDYNCERKQDDGFDLYELEFEYNDHEYEYDIRCSDGTILRTEKDHDDNDDDDKADRFKNAIGSDQALAIALKHAGLTKADVNEIEIDQEEDDGVEYYDVQFEQGEHEFEYEIHAQKGTILKFKKDD